jgi:flavodoxin
MAMKSLLIVFSYHHKNTEKIANVFATILNAQIKKPQETNPEELQNYDLIGIGSGIYSAKHHESLIDLADTLPHVRGKKAFLFSTAALTNEKKMLKDHSTLKEKLQTKGYKALDDFQCKGFNTNSFMKYLGGMNKGRPNDEDFRSAEEFIQNLLTKININEGLS